MPTCGALAWQFERGEEWMRWAALSGFVVAALSDGIDGYLARKWDQRTRLGAILDPVADKLLINTMVVVLAINREFLYPIPIALLVLVFVRDVIVLGGSYWVHVSRGPIDPKPRMLGKATTAINCLSITVILAELAIAPYVIWLMAIFNVLSAGDYLFNGLKDHPHRVTEASNTNTPAN